MSSKLIAVRALIRMTDMIVTLGAEKVSWCPLKRGIKKTYKMPKLKHNRRPIFWAIGSLSFRIVGSGSIRHAISIKMFPIPLTIYMVFRFPHDPG